MHQLKSYWHYKNCSIKYFFSNLLLFNISTVRLIKGKMPLEY